MEADTRRKGIRKIGALLMRADTRRKGIRKIGALLMRAARSLYVEHCST